MRNIFLEIGKNPKEIQEKLDKAYAHFFEGDADSQRICFDKAHDEAYIVDIGHNDIRSEGMSYGMTIAALLNRQDLFDKLWNFAQRYMKNKEGALAGYYSWQVSTADFTMMDPGPAPDGEEYFAAALLYAAKIFKNEKYKQDAIQLINDIAHKPCEGAVHTMMDANAGLVRFSPMEGNDFTDPSYNTVAFYRMYGEATGDKFWNQIAGNSVAYLKKATHPVTGLAADYSEFDGTPKATPWHRESDCFCGDAWRVAWNMEIPSGTWRYYDGTLYMLGLLACSGKFNV